MKYEGVQSLGLLTECTPFTRYGLRNRKLKYYDKE
jgi:hypothetical protein